ncbi:MAG TPA: alkaline phosphatase family protein, partial [Cellulomonas sp.]|nr:alkaline phosphatase family protein [Cellulomonas sp.]
MHDERATMTEVRVSSAAAGPLVDRAEAAGLVLPGAGPQCLGTVLPAVADALGADLDVDLGGPAARVTLGLPASERVCVVLVDGVGWTNLAERAGHAPFLRPRLAGSAPLTSTFPSTTATAMGTFGIAVPPGGTGMLGYTVRVPGTGVLGNLVSWTDMPPAQEWQRRPSVFERLVDAGVEVTSVGPARFAGSGLTQA